MSATLTWQNSGLGTKTGTAIANLMTDFKTLFDSKAADSAFKWQVSGSSLAGTPYFLVLKRKDGSSGRILFVHWSSAPAGYNTAILDQTPSTTMLYIAYFPAGNTDTASNLTAASGTIMGDDTNAVKCGAGSTVASMYGANIQPFYYECEEGILLGGQNPATTPLYGLGAGNLVVDAADTAYACTIGFGNATIKAFGDPAGASIPWVSAAPAAGGTVAAIRGSYDSNNKPYFLGLQPTGPWAYQAVSAVDILTKVSTNQAWFVPVPLLGQVQGEGFVLKLRQIAWGPATSGPFQVYNTTGPVVAARQFNAATAGGFGYPWVTNFKL